jgi:3'-5' exoribonuclease
VPHKLLFVAALLHDYGKIYDYEAYFNNDTFKIEYRHTDHKNKIHHIAASVLHLHKIGEKHGLSKDEIDAVTHAILAHHGQKQWGSPVEPQTKLAWILHCADMASARVNDTKDVV